MRDGDRLLLPLRLLAALALCHAVLSSPIRAPRQGPDGARYPNYLHRNFATCKPTRAQSVGANAPAGPARHVPPRPSSAASPPVSRRPGTPSPRLDRPLRC